MILVLTSCPEGRAEGPKPTAAVVRTLSATGHIVLSTYAWSNQSLAAWVRRSTDLTDAEIRRLELAANGSSSAPSMAELAGVCVQPACLLVEGDLLRDLLARGDDPETRWQYIQRSYPGRALVNIGPAVEVGDTAVVAWSQTSGPMAVQAVLSVLRRVAGEWRLVESIQLATS